MVGQVPTALAGGAGGVVLDIFSLVSISHFFLSLSVPLGDGPIWTEIPSQRVPLNPKLTANQPPKFQFYY